MKKVDEYRQRAEASVRLAQEVPDRLRAHLMDMARRWHALAGQSERIKSADTVYDPPSQASTGATQQQQQIQPRKSDA